MYSIEYSLNISHQVFLSHPHHCHLSAFPQVAQLVMHREKTKAQKHHFTLLSVLEIGIRVFRLSHDRDNK